MSDELDENESRLVDVLVSHAIGDHAADEQQRIDGLMKRLRADSEESSDVTFRLADDNRKGQNLARRRWPLLSASAVALICVCCVAIWFISNNEAYAAIERSIAAERLPVVRKYAVTVSYQRAGATFTRDFTLYVQHRRFVIETESRNGTLFLGGDSEQRWIVPQYGPVLSGNVGLLRRWDRIGELIEFPFLTTVSVLERLKGSYDCEMLSEEDVVEQADGSSLLCNHISAAKKKERTGKGPTRVDFQADPSDGIVRMIQVQWTRKSDEPGLLSADAKLIDMPDVSSDFFEHSGHHSSDRHVIERSE